MRAAQVREQLELGLVADHGLWAFDLDARGLQLHQQPVDRDLQDFSKLCNGDVGHKSPRIFRRVRPRTRFRAPS